MSGLITAIFTGITAFSATSIDELVILMLLFSKLNTTFHRRHIIVGLYLGSIALIVVSLPGFFGGLIVPRPWIGILGLVPMVIGLDCLINGEEDELEEVEAETEQFDNLANTSFLSPQTYSVAAIMFANGGDDIGVYVPLFASSTLESLLVILSVFLLLVGVLYYAAYQLTCQPAIADALKRYGDPIVPFVLIGLGVFIMFENRTLASPGLILITLVAGYFCLMTLEVDKD
jgi:cadmium resistance transport/sequestration family protein